MLTRTLLQEAAAALKTSGKEIDYPALATRLQTTWFKVRNFVEPRNGLRKKLGVVADYHFPGLVYMCAADDLRTHGEPVTVDTLAQKLNKRRKTVATMLLRHPEYRRLLNVTSRYEIERLRRERRYADCVHYLFTTKMRVSFSAIARIIGVSTSQVQKDMRPMADLQKFVGPNGRCP